MRPESSRLSKVITSIGFLLLYIPLLTLVIYSFVDSTQVSGNGSVWTLEWYRKLASNRLVIDALNMSLYVGFWSTVGSTLLGTTAALALSRTRFPGKKMFDAFTYVPLIMPEIVLGLSLLIWFV
jgi:ABC-type spermidine/putrescine transport system permease subunit II